jgi:hypothetical protein
MTNFPYIWYSAKTNEIYRFNEYGHQFFLKNHTNTAIYLGVL